MFVRKRFRCSMVARREQARESPSNDRYNESVIRSVSMTRVSRTLLGAIVAASLSACSTLGYYGHLAHGEVALLSARKPIARVVDDPSVDPTLRTRLVLAAQARAFASDRLNLPRNGSYTQYADLHRAYAIWNVFATPEFSLSPVQHCFPLAGCVAYRGYYDRALADAEGAELRAKGYDTWIGGVSTYSTLGWFDDPILNTMMRWDDDELIGTIFHELAHQKLYIKDDTEFNESLAMFVQREGLREWRISRGLEPVDTVRDAHSEEFETLVLATRDRLKELYAQSLTPDIMRERKRETIEQLRTDYFKLRDSQWNGETSYDDWIRSDINNAKLLPFGLYYRWVPAFARLFAEANENWEKFYVDAAAIGHLTPEERKRRLDQLLRDAK